MTALLDPDSAQRLAKICGLFGSAHDGERAAAAAKADSLVRGLGLTWREVITSPPTVPSPTLRAGRGYWQRMAAFCHARHKQLSLREQVFIRSMLAWRGEPSDKQLDWLSGIYARLYCEAAA